MKRYRVALTIGSLVIIPVATAAPANGGSGLPEQARNILRKHCYRCHGDVSVVPDYNVLDWTTLTATRKNGEKPYVTPGKPEQSSLWSHIGVVKDMPPTDPKPTEAEISIVKQWIESGSPLQRFERSTRPFRSEKTVLGLIRDDLRRASESDRKYVRYFTIHNLYNNRAVSDLELRLTRAALSKLINSLTWKAQIVVPRTIDAEKTVLSIDLRDLDWDTHNIWRTILGSYPYNTKRLGDADPETRDTALEIDGMTDGRLPYIRADWFIVTASRPPIYNKLLELPDTLEKLEKQLNVDMVDALIRGKVKRAGITASQISTQNRIIDRAVGTSIYYVSRDFASNEGTGNIYRYPLGPAFPRNQYRAYAFEHSAGEVVFSLPNGMPAYFLADARNNAISTGPVKIVSDSWRTSGNTEVVLGISCMGCHQNGIRRFGDSVRQGTALTGKAREKVEELYVDKEVMDRVLDQDERKFTRAIDDAVHPFLEPGDLDSDKNAPAEEPIRSVALYYYQDIDLPKAAAELGVEDSKKLADRLNANGKLQTLGLNPLAKGKTIKRTFWVSLENKSLSVFEQAKIEVDGSTPYLLIREQPLGK